jgi:hypothetical protein
MSTITTKLITEKHRQVDLDYDDVEVTDWSYHTPFDLGEDIMILDMKIEHNYDDHYEKWLCERLFQVRDSLDSFLRSNGTVIVLLSGDRTVTSRIGGKDYKINTSEILSKVGIDLSWGVREYDCVAQVDHESTIDYTNLVNTSEYYIDFSNLDFSNKTELITRGEHGSVCGVALRSFKNSGNGSLIILPRPDQLTIRPEEWFETALATAQPYFPQHLKNSIDKAGTQEDSSSNKSQDTEPEARIQQICSRFPKVARQIRERYDNRDTIRIQDEYDVQDLLHGLLRIDFDDVRDEEYSPSHAGSASRIDFLLKKEQIGIEVKYAEGGNSEKRLKTELSEDKEHYQAHPNCMKLICFIYNPHLAISNPQGFENDISSSSENIETSVVVSPK